MKRFLSSLLIIFLLSINAYAYQVETIDKNAYFFINGEFKGKDAPVKGVFDINIEEGKIKEIKTVIPEYGDVAKYDPTEWDIISNNNGNILATRLSETGQDLLCFRSDGKYYLVQNFFVDKDSGISPGQYTSLFFGEYTKK